MIDQDDSDPWTGELPKRDDPVSGYAVVSKLEAFKPLSSTSPVGQGVPDALVEPLFGEETHRAFAILDAAKVNNLAELLETSGLDCRCLFQGGDLADVAPWIVQLEEDSPFTRNLFTDGEAPWHLWGHEPGIVLTSNAPLDDIWGHFRRFTVFRGAGTQKMMLRFYDPAVAYTVLDYLSPRKADTASWFLLPGGKTVRDVFTRRRKPGELYRYRILTDLISETDVPKGRAWGETYQAHARDERDLMSSVQLAHELRRVAPPSWLPPDNKTFLFYILQSRKAARAYGLTEPALLTKFVYVGTVCAPFFWEEPATKQFLSQHRGSANARFADFYKLFKRTADRAKVPWRLPEP